MLQVVWSLNQIIISFSSEVIQSCYTGGVNVTTPAKILSHIFLTSAVRAYVHVLADGMLVITKQMITLTIHIMCMDNVSARTQELLFQL